MRETHYLNSALSVIFFDVFHSRLHSIAIAFEYVAVQYAYVFIVPSFKVSSELPA